MNLKQKRRLNAGIISLCILVFIFLFSLARMGGNEPVRDLQDGPVAHEDFETFFAPGRVTNASEILPPADEWGTYTQILYVYLTGSDWAGMTIEVTYYLPSPAFPPFDVDDRVVTWIGPHHMTIYNPDRSFTIYGLVAIFFALLLIIGGKRGLASAAGLLISLLSIVFVLMPLVLRGFSSIGVTLTITTLILIVNILLLSGIGAKSISAISGAFIGLLFASGFAFLAGHFARLTGYHGPYGGMLMVYADGVSLSGLFVSGVIIAAIGAITDTSMSIASSMEEVKGANPDIEWKALFKAGFNVGRDTMGTMSNTLILAFVGSSFSMMLFIFVSDVSIYQFMSHDAMAGEIIKGLAGSIGIILTVPATTFIGARILSFGRKK